MTTTQIEQFHGTHVENGGTITFGVTLAGHGKTAFSVSARDALLIAANLFGAAAEADRMRDFGHARSISATEASLTFLGSERMVRLTVSLQDGAQLGFLLPADRLAALAADCESARVAQSESRKGLS